MSQMEQDKTLDKALSKMKTKNQPDAEFSTLAIRMHKDLRGRISEHDENIKKETTKLNIKNI